jgi:hypothetical protein
VGRLPENVTVGRGTLEGVVVTFGKAKVCRIWKEALGVRVEIIRNRWRDKKS